MSQLVTQTTTYGLNSDQYSISTLSSVGGVLEIMAGNPHDELNAPTPIVDFKSDRSVTFYGIADLSAGVTLPQKIIGTNHLADAAVTSAKIASNVTIVGTLTGTASKATADGEGNNIVNTYATKTALTTVDNKLSTFAPKASPTFTGTVTVPTPVTSDNSTKAASTAFVKAQGYVTNTTMQSNLANYLPLTGGTVSGNVTVSGGVVHNGDSYFNGNPNYTNNSGHIFGIDTADWKYLGMYAYGVNAGGFEAFAEDSPNNARGFTCRARGTNGEFYDLSGHSDGTLQWAGRNVVRSVNGTTAGTDGNVTLGVGVYLKEKWVSGTQWYRVWSDGYIEQGGFYYPKTTSVATFTLQKAYSNTNYTILISSSWTGNHAEDVSYSNKTTTSFQSVSGSAASNFGIYWATFGY